MVREFSQLLLLEQVFFFPHPTYSGVSTLVDGSDILEYLRFWYFRQVFNRPTACFVALLPGS